MHSKILEVLNVKDFSVGYRAGRRTCHLQERYCKFFQYCIAGIHPTVIRSDRLIGNGSPIRLFLAKRIGLDVSGC